MIKYISILIFLQISLEAKSLPNLVWFIKELKYSVVIARVISVNTIPNASIITPNNKYLKSLGLYKATISVENIIFSPKGPADVESTHNYYPFHQNVLLETASDNPNIWQDKFGRKAVIMIINDHPEFDLEVSKSCIGHLPLDQLALVEKEIALSIIIQTKLSEKWFRSYTNRISK